MSQSKIERKKVQKTFRPKESDIKKNWWLIDANSRVLGRLATQISILLRGKHKPYYSPDIDTGDFVIVTNCAKIHLSGNKLEKKKYYRHSKYVGSLKETTAQEMLQKKPEKLLFFAVKGMLPKNRLGSVQIKKLKLFAGSEHKHAAQKPSLYSMPTLKHNSKNNSNVKITRIQE